MPRSVLALAAVTALACASRLAQGPGADVRPVEGVALARCTRLSTVEALGGNGPSTADNERVATDEVRRKVAGLGGNAYAITHRDVGRWRTVVTADAYICPRWEPVRGLEPLERR